MTARSRCLGSSFALALAVLASCGDDDGPAGGGGGGGSGAGGGSGDGGMLVATPEQRLALVSDVAKNVIVPAYEEFLDAATALEAAAADYAADVESTESRAAVLAAFDTAIASFERAEVMHVGPAAKASDMLGGQGIRDRIYSWPLVDRCAVDTKIGDMSYAASLGIAPTNVRDLSALEYLLYRQDDGHSCANAPAGFPAGSELAQRRADYARNVAALVRQHAQTLVDAWNASFLGYVQAAGTENSVYSSAQLAMNAFTNAMFYVEVQVKDQKIAIPAGISILCPSTSCPDAVESPWSNRSLDHIRENLYGFERMYFGGTVAGVDGGAAVPGNGFDDLLRALGQHDLAGRMETALADAIAAVDTVPAPLETAVVNDAAAVEALYEAVRELTTLLKTEFLAVLDLDRPPVAGSDTD